MPHHIVIVEDEPVTQARLQSYFTQEGYTVSVTASGAGLREIMQNQPVDLILLDINLPDENGLMLTRALRERSTVGIILVTGRSDRIDRIVGLEMGADDYVTKPLELRELVVRVKNLLWRIDLARQAQPHTQDNCYRFAGYCLNVSRHTLERDGEPIKLTRAEYEMLVAFVTNPGEILSRERLLRMLSARRVENPDPKTLDGLCPDGAVNPDQYPGGMVQPALYQPGGKRQHSGIDSYHEYGAPVERSQRLGTFRRAEPDQCR